MSLKKKHCTVYCTVLLFFHLEATLSALFKDFQNGQFETTKAIVVFLIFEKQVFLSLNRWLLPSEMPSVGRLRWKELSRWVAPPPPAAAAVE